ncbi:MAG: hypothetical protein FWD61_19410 [Phycisphaerales bacterium]|nr:hypothetical protein [Phycisphaerales bacterium]
MFEATAAGPEMGAVMMPQAVMRGAVSNSTAAQTVEIHHRLRIGIFFKERFATPRAVLMTFHEINVGSSGTTSGMQACRLNRPRHARLILRGRL